MNLDIQSVFHMAWCIRWMPMFSFTVPGQCLNLFKPLLCRVAVNIFYYAIKNSSVQSFYIILFLCVAIRSIFKGPDWMFEERKQGLPWTFCLSSCLYHAQCTATFLLLYDHFSLLIQYWYMWWKFSLVRRNIPLLSSCIVLRRTRTMCDTLL